MKSRSFTIYLLKSQYTGDDSLKDGHPLEELVGVKNLPTGAKLYLLDQKAYSPWWRDYWGIDKNIKQSLQGAIVFIPVNGRFFALTFGHTYHYLKEYSYEYDFGLKITLNSLDPNKLKSTDILYPENSQRQRIQSPIESDITFFNFDHDSSVISRLTGNVKDEYKDVFSNTTGASGLAVAIKKNPEEISGFLSQILIIYNKTDYKKTFPDIHNVVPLHDPIIIDKLNLKLIDAFINKSKTLVLSIPDVVDYNTNLNIYFSGAGRKQQKVYSDVYIDYYRDYLSDNSKKNITIQDIQKHSMNLCNDDGYSFQGYSVFKSLLFDCEISGNSYHLCEGNWYQVDDDYLKSLNKFLDPYFYEDDHLIEYDHDSEDVFNKENAKKNKNIICLDRENIAPKNQTAVEPCDLYRLERERAIFYHVKLSTRSSTLSHLFNQGLVSIELLRTEAESKNKLKELITHKVDERHIEKYLNPINNDKIGVVYAIITHKDNENKARNLPLFSRISLKRCINMFRMMNIDIKICFVMDKSDKKTSKIKKRKKKDIPSQ
jgi:uncharacterized protein (TIGR04141 family)